MEKKRCPWCGNDPLYIAYHDQEWGVPSHDDQHLFEMLVLESMQSGLSWSTILRKREGFRKAFHGFDFKRVAKYHEADVVRLLNDPGIIRNRAKIEAAINNARAVKTVIQRTGSLHEYLWQTAVGGRTIVNRWEDYKSAPAQTEESVKLARQLKADGFKFLGPTTCYAFMQAVGMVNDHEASCFTRKKLARRT